MNAYGVVITTAATKKDAQKIADYLIEHRLAACVQVTDNVTSIYSWKGKIERNSECVLQIKTRQMLFEAVEKAIKTVHRYDVPEIIMLPVINGSKEYLGWLNTETTDKWGRK